MYIMRKIKSELEGGSGKLWFEFRTNPAYAELSTETKAIMFIQKHIDNCPMTAAAGSRDSSER